MSHKLTRLELYQLVWSEPLRKLGQRMGISDVAIAKHCRKANIPLPGIGYWAKKEAGKPVLQPPFPARGLGQSDVVIIGGKSRYYGWYPQESDEEVLAATITPPPPFPDGLPEITAHAKELVGKVRAIASLANAHPSITRLLQDDEQRREKQKASRYPSSFDAPLFDSRFERRRLRLMNSLMLAFARCGCAPSLGREPGSVSIQVGDERVGFRVEPLKGQPERQYPRKPIPDDAKMKVELGWYEPPPEIMTCWKDDTATLEDQLQDIAIGLIVAGEWAYRRSIQRQYEHRLCRQRRLLDEIRREKEEAARKERERLEKIEADRRNQLIREMLAWRRALDIRNYVEAQLAHRRLHADPETLASLETWASWAVSEADRIDPLLRNALPGTAK